MALPSTDTTGVGYSGAPVATAAGTELSAKLNDPQVAAALSSLLDHAALLAILAEGLDQLVARSEVIGDSLIAGVAELRETVEETESDSKIDVGEVAKAGLSLAGALPKAAPGMVAAVDSGVIDRVLSSALVSPQAIDQVGMLAGALTRAGELQAAGHGVAVHGMLSLPKLLKDPDINRALSYFATVAKVVGAELAAPAQPNA